MKIQLACSCYLLSFQVILPDPVWVTQTPCTERERETAMPSSSQAGLANLRSPAVASHERKPKLSEGLASTQQHTSKKQNSKSILKKKKTRAKPNYGTLTKNPSA